jgi:hypothetical protein
MVFETCENCGAAPEPENPEITATDVKPEYVTYKDEGCRFHPSCLQCPYPTCFYDRFPSRRNWLKEKRNLEISKLADSGWKIKDLCLLFGLSYRTVQRIIIGKYPGVKPEVEEKDI